MRNGKILNIMWDSMVYVSVFVLFCQLIINALYAFKYYWLINFFILVALFHLISIKVTRADLVRKAKNDK